MDEQTKTGEFIGPQGRSKKQWNVAYRISVPSLMSWDATR